VSKDGNYVPQISAVLIVKNEQAVLGQTLQALRQVVDEIVVADTGSSDNTVAIARAHSDRLIHIEWQSDFAQARNQALQHATCDWVLSIDADEVIQQPELARRLLHRFVNMHPQGVVGSVEVISATRHNGQVNQARSHISRFFPRLSMRFEGAIHEQLVWSDGCCRTISTGVRLDHSGYDQDSDDPNHKAYRNIPMLKEVLKTEPDDVYFRFQLGRAYFTVGQYGKTIEELELMLSLVDFDDGRPGVDKRGQIVARETLTTAIVSLGYALVNLHRIDEADALIEQHGLANHPGTQCADFHHLRGYIGLMQGDIDKSRDGYNASIVYGIEGEDVEGCGSFSSAYHLGLLAEAEGNPQAATSQYAQSLAFKSNYAPALNRYIDFCIENAFEIDNEVAAVADTYEFQSLCQQRLMRSSNSPQSESAFSRNKQGASSQADILREILQRLSQTHPLLVGELLAYRQVS
jgi:glycosyltransferase involved in cell wall biosynthesis